MPRVKLDAHYPQEEGWPSSATGEMEYEEAVSIGRHYAMVHIAVVDPIVLKPGIYKIELSDSIIDRAARVITPEWDRASANTKRNARLTVAAVFDSVREPTAEMLRALYDGYWSGSGEREKLTKAWQKAVDVILSDKPV